MPVNYTYYSFTYRHFDYYHPVRSVIGTLFKEQNYETEVKLENVHFRTILGSSEPKLTYFIYFHFMLY